MNRLIDYSSRFRILKGGKISLVVGALALGSLVNIANAVDTYIDTVMTSMLYYDSVYTDTTNSFFLSSLGSVTITDDAVNYGIYIDQNTNTVNVKTSGTISLLNMNETAEPGATAIYTRGSGNFRITNNNNINVSSSGYGAYGIINSGSAGFITNNSTITVKYEDNYDHKAYSIESDANIVVTNNSNGTLNGNLNIAGTFTNKGKVSLPYNATNTNNASVTTFINTPDGEDTGILEIGLLTDGTTTTHSQLSTTDARFEDGSTINVNVLAASTDVSSIDGITLNDVVSASNSLTINGTLNITDNSTLLAFTYVKDGNTIDLKETIDKTIFDSAVLGGAEGFTKTTAKTLQTIKDAGTYSQMDSVFAKFNALSTDQEVAQKIEETTPQTATSSVAASNHVAQGISNIVTQRQNVNLGGGINSGDEMLVEKNIWFKPFGSFGSQNDKDGINGFDINTYGLAFGMDGEYQENQKFGLGFFYTNASVDVNNVVQSSDLDVFSLVAYGSNTMIDNKTKFMYQLGYSLQKNDSSRLVTLTNDTASADYTSKTASVDLKLLRDYKVNDDLVLQPMISSTYRHFSNPSYSETGAGALNLDVEKFTTTELLVGLGTMAHYKLNDSSKIIGNVNVDYDLHDRTTTVTSSYQGASGVTFDTDGIDNGRWSYDVGVAYENQIDDLSNINFSYNYQGKGSDYSNNVISAKYTYRF